MLGRIEEENELLAAELLCLLHLRQIRRTLGIGGILCGACSWRSGREAAQGLERGSHSGVVQVVIGLDDLFLW